VIYACCEERRRAAVLGNPSLNGIDYLEVLDHDAPPGSPRQQSLLLHCLKAAPANLQPANVLITGGESITGVSAVWIAPATNLPPEAEPAEVTYFGSLPNAANVLVVRTNEYGDFSPYTLRLVGDAEQASVDPFEVTESLDGFDPQLTEVTFNFKVECGPDFDCLPATPPCPPEDPSPPPINYLTKDYGSFKTVLLDRLNQLLPEWQGTSEADIGIVLAELIAAVGDHLSYQQDAVSTEAYLLTARSRISLRRHARLVDYPVHDGCNARAWIRLTVSAQFVLDQATTRFYAYAPGMPASLAVGAGNEEAAVLAGVVVFQPMQDATPYPEHNELQLYTWGDEDCCLPRGATEATLLGSYPNLAVGDVLIFQEVMGPQTGVAADADVRHRCAVRLTSVTTTNGRGQPLVDPLFEDGTGAPIVSASQTPTPVTEIAWSAEDALPIPVCISSTFLDSSGAEQSLTGVSVAYGNVVLADHGLTMPATPLDVVPEPTLFYPSTGDRCDPGNPTPFPVRYRPQLSDRPLTQAVPLPLTGTPTTANPVALQTSGAVGLLDTDGYTSLLVSADAPASWPQYFGLQASPNAVDPANFDLAVVYAPAGAPSPVVLERFTDLTLAPATPNNAIAELNTRSQFVSVPSAFVPPAANPTAFPAGPTMLANTGAVDLQDASNTTYLSVQAKNPLAWPPLFGVLAQGDIAAPEQFNLVLVYQPPSGAVGVSVPVVVEETDDLTLATVSAAFAAGSQLITVRSFEAEPNVALSAQALTSYDADTAVPAITLTGALDGVTTDWTAEADLLGDGPQDTHFVVELESDGTAVLRFGDDVNGARPKSGTGFSAVYRIGNGAAGNVGADSLTYFAGDPRIEACTNPLAAAGGQEPETSEQIRRRAPEAFLTQERAVTMTDYATRTEDNSQVEDAAAALRWTGSWYTVAITAEPTTGGDLVPALRKTLIRYVDRYRLAGQDLMIDGPDYVPLELELTVCVDPDYFRSDVQSSLQLALGSGELPDGQLAFFAPGRFTLGGTVYLSPIYRAARSVAGVQTVTATVFQPQGPSTTVYLDQGEIPLSPSQVARLDNDPSYPGHGRLTLVLEGGK
jgi:Baseplate J-like protein